MKIQDLKKNPKAVDVFHNTKKNKLESWNN